MVFPIHINIVDLVFKGMLIGMIASAPMGPVGILCVQRTLNKGRWYGFATGIGAALSDIIYAGITGFGMAFVMDFINNEQNKFYLQIAGSVLLLAFGIYTWRMDPTKNMHQSGQQKGYAMKHAIYPGSFDPVTKGHLDIIERSSKMVDKLIVAVLKNSSKSPLFTVEERVSMLKEITKDIPNVEIDSFSGLLVDFAEANNATIIVRGLRAVTDFEYELQMSQTNRIMDENVDTIFLTTSLEYAYLSSSTVKEVAIYGGDVSKFVPSYVVDKIKDKINALNNGGHNE